MAKSVEQLIADLEDELCDTCAEIARQQGEPEPCGTDQCPLGI